MTQSSFSVPASSSEGLWLNRFSILTSSATFLLIVAGAMVTSTGSGLAVPDWPLSFGQFFPPMVGGVLFEHGHRMIAGTVGILMAVLAAWLWLRESRRWLRGLAAVALGAVVLQAVLGGLTVLYRLPPLISISHAVLAQTFFCLTVSIALFTSSFWKDRETESDSMIPPRVSYLCALTTLFAFLQLIIGARLRHGGGQAFLQLHIAGAVLVSLGVIAVFWVIRAGSGSDKSLSNLSTVLLLLLSLQIFMGAVMYFPALRNLISVFAPLETAVVTLHVGMGALILASSFILTMLSFRTRRT